MSGSQNRAIHDDQLGKNERGVSLKFTLRLLLVLFLQAGLLLQALPVKAQESGTVAIDAPQFDQFPTVYFHFNAYNGEGNFIDNLPASAIEIVEDRQIIQPDQVEMIDTGVQTIIAINTSPALASNASGMPEYERIKEALQNWAGAQAHPTLDDYSLATPTGLFLIRGENPRQLHQALSDFQPDLQMLQPSLNSLAEALDLATDPLRDPLAKRSILYITPPLPPNLEVNLVDLSLRARDIGAQVNIWLMSPTAPAVSAEPGPLQMMAETTGGKFFQVAPTDSLPEIELLFESLRHTYRVHYTSKIQNSQPHALQMNIRHGATLLTSNQKRFDLTIEPPNPIFIDPPAVIRRSWKVSDERGASPYLSPRAVDLQVLVEFPDQHPRPITATQLFVNGELVDENTTEPFDRFTLVVEDLTAPENLLVRVEAVDALGLSGTSTEIPVEILVDQPASTSLYNRLSERGMVAVAAIMVSGIALTLVMAFTGSRRRRWGQQKNERSRMKDPVTQPVAIPSIPNRKDTTRPKKERDQAGKAIPIWPRSTSQTSPARLVILDENEQPVTGGSIPLARQEITFGSDPQRATQVLNSATVDGLHARLYRSPEGIFYLADQNSVAGTWINYAPVTSSGARLEHGDLLHIGKVMFRFEISDPTKIPIPQVKVTDLDSEE